MRKFVESFDNTKGVQTNLNLLHFYKHSIKNGSGKPWIQVAVDAPGWRHWLSLTYFGSGPDLRVLRSSSVSGSVITAESVEIISSSPTASPTCALSLILSHHGLLCSALSF